MKEENVEFKMERGRIGLFNTHFQNFKQFGIPKAQLILADVPYNLGINAYASNLSWYKDGDNKKGESKLAGREFFKRLREEKGLEWDGEKFVEIPKRGDFVIVWDKYPQTAKIELFKEYNKYMVLDKVGTYYRYKTKTDCFWFKAIKWDGTKEQYERIIKDNGAIVLFGQGLFFVDLINSNRKLFRYDLVWDKQLISGFLNANRMPLRVHENIAVFYKKLPTYNPQYTEGKPLHSKGKSYLNKEHKNENYGKFKMTDDNRAGSTQKHPKSIISFQKPHPSIAQHRTEKSIEMLEWLIKTYSNENDTILDNTFGSCTTGIACINTNRNFIGIELDENYYNISKKRVEEKRKEKEFNLITSFGDGM